MGFVFFLALLLTPSFSMAREDHHERTINFDIPRQRADLALTQFAEQVGLTLIFPYDKVRERPANRLVGDYTLEEAINVLLQGSGLTPSFSDQRVLNIMIDEDKAGDNMNTNKSFLAGMIGLLVGTGGTQGASAQSVDNPGYGGRPGGLEEIVVTATRREEGLQSIPVSIAAVTSADLEKRGITNFQDITQTISGLYLAQGDSSSNTSLRMRGIGTTGSTTTDPSVGVVVDGVYQVRKSSAFTELHDIDRIEVLRGPQGTNFGKNTTSGLIAIYTKDPETDAFSGNLQGVVGNLNNRELRGVVNVPIVEDRLALRVGAYNAQRDGYTKNVHIGKDTRNVDRQGGRARLLWNATDSLTLKLSAEYLNMKSDVDQGLVEYGLLPNAGVTLPYEEWYALAGLTPPPIGLGKSQQQHSEMEETVERYLMNVQWDIPRHTLVSITAFEKLKAFSEVDRDRSTLDFSTLVSEPKTDVLTQEIQLSSNMDSVFSYILGGFYQNEELLGVTSINGNIVSLAEWDLTSKALFGNLTYEVNDRLSLVGGLRWTEDEKASAGHFKTFREWTYTAKVLYQLADDKLLYFTHDKGFKSGGINRIVPDGDESYRFWQPEITFNYEVGLKSEWLDNRLRLNAALFHQVFEDYQASTPIETTAATEVSIFISNAAEAVSQGLEVDFTALLTDHLTINGSASWIRAKYEDYERAPCPAGNYPGCVNGVQDLSGKRLDNAPTLTFNLGAEYRAELGRSGLEWFARADASYRDDAHLDGFLSSEAIQDSYTLYNARAGLDSPGRWKATLWGNNLTNKEYTTSGSYSNFGLVMYKGPVRTYGMTLDWFF